MTIKLTPYITLDGNAKEAIRFYEQAVGAEVLSLMTYEKGKANPQKDGPYSCCYRMRE